MKILLVGGGTGGPVRPLLAVAEALEKQRKGSEFLLVGTKTGPERTMAEHAHIPFVAIAAGKLRRYFSFQNFVAPFLVVVGFFQSLRILRKFKPHVVFGAGGFVQVPVVAAAALLRIPVLIHQQDVVAGLANKISNILATKVTVSFQDSEKYFHQSMGFFLHQHADRVVWTGNPFAESWELTSREKALQAFGLTSDLPVLFVFGGGTGSKSLNDIIYKALPNLSRYVQILHATGAGKHEGTTHENYHAYEFIPNMHEAFAAADIVLCRAGMSTITELAHLGKVAIVVPLPNSPANQEPNAWMLYKHKAAFVVDQGSLSEETLVALVRKLLFDHATQEKLKHNIRQIMPKGSAEKVAQIIVEMAQY